MQNIAANLVKIFEFRERLPEEEAGDKASRYAPFNHQRGAMLMRQTLRI